MIEVEYLGNKKILKAHKTAFLCSRKVSSETILKSLDWAVDQKNQNKCIISGFHSPIEKDVFNILLKGEQPIILVLARGMQKRWTQNIRDALDKNRLLILSPFPNDVVKITRDTAEIRNRYMLELADDYFIPYLAKGGMLDKILYEKNNSLSLFQ
ncbi:MAG: DNA-binding protein [Candidatus Marinimicrobia bacterium]|nr:DNA-binding protein [Candidatus Neomarinimicrobiota bacterium]